MNDTVLMVLSVREIQSVVNCINNLNCEKIWFKGYKEYELAPILNDFIKKSNFKNYFITSDDAIISYENFELLKKHLHSNDIISGWGIYRQNGEFTTIINPKTFNSPATKFAYCNPKLVSNIFQYSYKTHEIHTLPDIVESAFTGWFFTGMKKELWLEYPFQTLNWPYSSSDLLFSKRIIADKKYKQMIVKKAHCIHLSNTIQKSFYNKNTAFNKQEIVKTF